MTTPAPERITAPRPPGPTPPFRFPIIASLAPLLAAVALWLITSSPFALIFAVLGPMTAIASFADSKIGGRKILRRELKKFAQDAAAVVAAIDAGHVNERSDLAEIGPGAEEIARRHGADPYRWRESAARPIFVSVGTANIASSLILDSSVRTVVTAVDAELEEIERHAAVVRNAPVLVDARLGVGICGSSVLARALARAIALQLAWQLSPAAHWVASGSLDSVWTDVLPHASRQNPREGHAVEFGAADDDRPVAMVALAPRESDLPGDCRIVVSVGGDGACQIVQHPDRNQRRQVNPGVVSEESAVAWAHRARAEAIRDGIVALGDELPHSVALEGMLHAATRSSVGDQPTLAVAFAVDATGEVDIDLIKDGPHAVIGGTTGSGKSELLISWVLALAARYAPGRVNFLLLDFKGGSAFDSLAVLPHSVGIITDLDATEANRALSSLRAELKYRERVLARAGKRDIRDLPATGDHAMARLVIVADEFAAMLAEHPDLHPLFADIASRGRSLGVHLILCTQRPAGIVRDGVLANTDLRISLRVNNRGDSSSVVGTDVAADLPVLAVGRGVLAFAGARPKLVQFAIASPGDAVSIMRRWPQELPQRKPWCEPLPSSVTAEDVEDFRTAHIDRYDDQPDARPPAVEVRFGLTDLPHEQRRGIATWDPVGDGHVLVLGASRSGKSSAIRALAHGGQLLPDDVPAAWDAIAGYDTIRDTVMAIDDLDSLLARFPAEYRDVFIERLSRLLRDGPARGVRVVMAAQRLTADANHVAALVPARLMLRHANKSDFVLAGGAGADFDMALPPGGGLWRGVRTQVIQDPAPLGQFRALTFDEPTTGRPWAVVTSRASAVAGDLAAAGLDVLPLDTLRPGEWESTLRGGQAVVGDVEEWQSRWGVLPALRSTAYVMFDRCTIADYRALARTRELPPPLDGMTGAVWIEGQHGAGRALLPLARTPERVRTGSRRAR